MVALKERSGEQDQIRRIHPLGMDGSSVGTKFHGKS